MRVLAASRYVGEAGVESYIATPLTQAMTMPPMEAAVRFTSVTPLPSIVPNGAQSSRAFTETTNDLQLRPRLPILPQNARLFREKWLSMLHRSPRCSHPVRLRHRP